MNLPNAITATQSQVIPDEQWETLVSEGLQYREETDDRFWKLGELVSRVKKQYGKSSVDLFAGEIGERSKTLRGYYRVYKEFSTQVDFRHQNALLSFSHFRAALRMKKRGLPAMLALLTEANDSRWSAAFTEARAIDDSNGKPTAPLGVQPLGVQPRLKRVCKDVPCRITMSSRVRHVLDIDLNDDMPADFVNGEYLITISQKQAEEEAQP